MKEPLKLIVPTWVGPTRTCKTLGCHEIVVSNRHKYCDAHKNEDRHLIKSSHQRRKNDKKNLGI